MARQINYFRIGSFVIGGLVLLVIMLIIFGSGRLFKKTIYAETYFSESVQGLIVGSPVKYLGMEIGRVREIAAADSVYKLARPFKKRFRDRYVYVKMAISPEFFLSKTGNDIQAEIEQDVANGLRVKLALQGLTGNAYLELDFVDPKTTPLLPISWKPDNYYIPSAPSALTYFSDSVQNLIRKLQQADFKKLFANIQKFTSSARDTTTKFDVLLQQTNRSIIDTINNLRDVSNNLNLLSAKAKAFPSHMIFGAPPPKLDLNKL